MARSDYFPWLSALLLTGAACGSAYADQVAVPDKQPIAQVAKASPYKVDLIDEEGHNLNVYQHGGRFYVLGQSGERYSIRVSNPTARRVEAVVSVDGLDAIDGQPADFVRKRGYVVPPNGTLRVDGFRVSTSQVATFRFSSVSQSYAGRKGIPRNVGVIGVAIFEEQAAPVIIQRQPPPPPPYYGRYRGGYDDGKDKNVAPDTDEGDDDMEAEAPAEPTGGNSVGGSGGAPAPTNTHQPAKRDYTTTMDRRHCCNNKPQEKRSGLGTKFGERRYSNVTWTRFVRANEKVPTALAELRYNDAQGLTALGIRVLPAVDPNELDTRETADPFPHSRGFANPPNGW